MDSEHPPAYINIWPRGGAKSTHLELAVVYLGAKGTMDSDDHRELEANPVVWVHELFPEYMGGSSHGYEVPMAPHHVAFWEWIGQLPAPRRYALYTSDTQDQADDHVANIAAMLTSREFALMYPFMADRRVTQYGQSAGWRRNRIRTAGGLTVDAAGLETAARGLKLEANRPDLECFDDLDQENDSATATERKRRSITRAILPARAHNCAVVAVQNLVLRGGIFDQLVTGTADFLYDRVISGPHPALRDFEPERDLARTPNGRYEVIGGEPTWVGQNRQVCQEIINSSGLESFMIECQHRMDVISDLVFPQFSPDRHEWRSRRKLEFVQFYGGVDHGGEGLTAHYSAATVLGLTEGGRLILLEEFYGRGPNIAERQVTWMQKMVEKYGRIKWCEDGDERTAHQFLRGLGFDLTLSKRGRGSVEERVKRFGRRLMPDVNGRPGFSYMPNCTRFRDEILRWRRRPPKMPDEPARREILSVEDDVLVSVLYAAERVELDRLAADAVRVSVRV